MGIIAGGDEPRRASGQRLGDADHTVGADVGVRLAGGAGEGWRCHEGSDERAREQSLHGVVISDVAAWPARLWKPSELGRQPF